MLLEAQRALGVSPNAPATLASTIIMIVIMKYCLRGGPRRKSSVSRKETRLVFAASEYDWVTLAIAGFDSTNCVWLFRNW